MSLPVLHAVSLKNGVFSFHLELPLRQNPGRRRNPAVSKQERDAVMAEMYKRYSKKGLNQTKQEREDNASMAAIAVDAAARDYDPTKTALTFSQYVVTKIEQAIAEARRSTGGGRRQAEAGKELNEYIRAYRRLHPTGSAPTEMQLAEVSGQTVQYIQDLRMRASEGRTVSMSASAAGAGSDDEGDESTIGDMLASADAEEVQDVAAARAEVRKKAARADKLTREEEYFVGWHAKGLNITQIADRMDMSYTKARGLAKKLKDHLLTGGAG